MALVCKRKLLARGEARQGLSTNDKSIPEIVEAELHRINLHWASAAAASSDTKATVVVVMELQYASPLPPSCGHVPRTVYMYMSTYIHVYDTSTF